MLLKQLIDAKFTLIKVSTDDPSTIEETLESLLGEKIPLHKVSMKTVKVSYSFKHDPSNEEIRLLGMSKRTLILVNYQGDNPAVYDAGELPTPTRLLRKTILAGLKQDQANEVLDAVSGLSYRKAKQLINLAEVRGIPLELTPLKNLRFELYGMDDGLYPMPKLNEAYSWDETLKAWADANLPYLKAGIDTLTPRGILLHGSAGTGKTMAVKALAETVGIPAFRLDIGASLSKWSGESEARIRKHLAYIEQQAPCILLIDEVEKVIKTSDEDTVSTRILAQLLWWLAEHRTRVLTVMTSNNIDALPKELYREGRCDAVFLIDEMPAIKAQEFAKNWVNSFLADHNFKANVKDLESIREHLIGNLSGREKFSPAYAVEVAKQAIKRLKLML